jgi:hypothetical protein
MTTSQKPNGRQLMPYGTGSIQVRGTKWWHIVTDETGRRLQQSTGTDDRDEALRIAVRRSIAILKARIGVLRAVLDETPRQGARARTAGRGEARHRGEHAGGSGPVRRDAGQRAEKKTATTRGGKQ